MVHVIGAAYKADGLSERLYPAVEKLGLCFFHYFVEYTLFHCLIYENNSIFTCI